MSLQKENDGFEDFPLVYDLDWQSCPPSIKLKINKKLISNSKLFKSYFSEDSLELKKYDLSCFIGLDDESNYGYEGVFKYIYQDKDLSVYQCFFPTKDGLKIEYKKHNNSSLNSTVFYLSEYSAYLAIMMSLNCIFNLSFDREKFPFTKGDEKKQLIFFENFYFQNFKARLSHQAVEYIKELSPDLQKIIQKLLINVAKEICDNIDLSVIINKTNGLFVRYKFPIFSSMMFSVDFLKKSNKNLSIDTIGVYSDKVKIIFLAILIKFKSLVDDWVLVYKKNVI
jgi:hypothetical protein